MSRLSRLLFGRLVTHCAECGAKVPEGEGFRPSPLQVYCCEEHAVADQENNPL